MSPADDDAPGDLRYSGDHLWVRAGEDESTIGVTAFACDQLGDIVYVELPAGGDAIHQDEPFGVIESVKTVHDLFAPVSGTVTARNEAVLQDPGSVGDAPYGEGWLLRIRPGDRAELDALHDADGYRALIVGSED